MSLNLKNIELFLETNDLQCYPGFIVTGLVNPNSQIKNCKDRTYAPTSTVPSAIMHVPAEEANNDPRSSYGQQSK
ncbi:Uncharacterised protein [Legionella pneumophila]|nr:Uncharacterised protein [Legionella pneumophila]CZF99271.1 Uncharacterised protein [Legionella pneumophila]CZG01122.1 Uncharacterised protein [Legionella pneumophila]CZG01455.1 Uncharacterised protein [Legionella pneumophila]CZG01504.1 Uncharacterised protein [Legionella pneumophila]